MANLPARLKQSTKLHGDSLLTANPEHNNQENWRSFDSSSEAGRLLAKLYGNQYKPAINYPTLKKRSTNSMANNSGKWHPTGKGSVRGEDPRVAKFNKTKAMNVNVPRVGQRQRANYAAVDLVPRKKNAASCQLAIEDTMPKMSSYRPPHMHAFSSDEEKARLSEVFTHKGGAALPKELTHPVGPMPSEIRQRQAEAQRIEEAKARRRARLNGGVDPLQAADPGDQDENVNTAVLDPKSQLFDFIYQEIIERRKHQEELEMAGASTKSTQQAAAREISSRISRLKQIDKERAEEAISKLYA